MTASTGYRLLIVDDEDEIREGLADIIDWRMLGYTVVQKLKDGKEVIDFLTHHDADVVLSDIKMTFVSGLEVAKYIHQYKPETKVVLLSGYKEFEMAQEAIQYHVAHYLLKPTNLDQVTATFRNLRQILDHEKAERERKQAERNYFDELLPLVQEHWIGSLLSGYPHSKEDILSQVRLLHFPIHPETSECLVFSIDAQNLPPGGIQAVIHAISGEKEQILYFPVRGNGQTVRTLSFPNHRMETKTEWKSLIMKQIETLKKSLKSLLGLDIEPKIAGEYSSILHLAQSLASGQESLPALSSN
jgi:two-component system response regulator YesN